MSSVPESIWVTGSQVSGSDTLGNGISWKVTGGRVVGMADREVSSLMVFCLRGSSGDTEK